MSGQSENPKEKPKPDILAATPGLSVSMSGEFTDVVLLPWTYSWPKRILCFIAWKVPPFRWVVRWFARGLGIENPYCKVVALIQSHPAILGADIVKRTGEA